MRLLLKWFLMAISIMIAAYLLPSVFVSGFWSALWVALFLALVNVTLRPILILLTLPITIVTLGLFILVINALMVLLTSSVISGFSVGGFWQALVFSLLLSLISFIFNKFLLVDKYEN